MPLHGSLVLKAKPIGVVYELKVFVAETADEKLHKRNSVSLAVRKASGFRHLETSFQSSSINSLSLVIKVISIVTCYIFGIIDTEVNTSMIYSYFIPNQKLYKISHSLRLIRDSYIKLIIKINHSHTHTNTGPICSPREEHQAVLHSRLQGLHTQFRETEP